MSNRIVRYFKEDNFRFAINNSLGFYKRMPDDKYIKLMFRSIMGYELPLENPKTFNEKLQWIKLYDRNPQYTIMADKVKAKEYVSELLGDSLIIPTLGVWDRADIIDFSSLPKQFVLKCNHNSGLGMTICTDKDKLDIKKTISDARRGLKQNYYMYGREWAYKDIPRRIFAEKYMIDKKEGELRDYKFFCFGGKCKFFKIDFDRFTEHHANYFDLNRNLLTLGEVICPPKPDKKLRIPDTIDKMVEYAEILSKNHPFLRVDFYDVDGHIYFGEMTFYPSSGFGPFTEEKWDRILGDMLQLPNIVK